MGKPFYCLNSTCNCDIKKKLNLETFFLMKIKFSLKLVLIDFKIREYKQRLPYTLVLKVCVAL